MEKLESKIRKHIYFYGRVQGVGFRYYAVQKANQLGLTGWVRNLSDGSVEMEVEEEVKEEDEEEKDEEEMEDEMEVEQPWLVKEPRELTLTDKKKILRLVLTVVIPDLRK